MTTYYQNRGDNRDNRLSPGDIFIVGKDTYGAMRAVAVGGVPHQCNDCPLREKGCSTGKYTNKPRCRTGDEYVYLKQIKTRSLTTVVGNDSLRVEFTVIGSTLHAKTLDISDALCGSNRGSFREFDLGRLGSYRVRSLYYHEQCRNTLCLQGASRRPDDTSQFTYDSLQEAKLARKAFQTIIRLKAGQVERV